MEELVRLITNINVETSHLSHEKIQEVLINAKRYKNKTQSNLEEWSRLSELLWSHIETGLNETDNQLLCATAFFSVLILTDQQESYLKKMQEILQKEITLRSTELKDSANSLQAASLMYGMFQSSFLTQCIDKSILYETISATFNLLILIGYEYSQFTFIAFKTMNSYKRICGTDIQDFIYSTENQTKLLNLVNHNWENPITGVRDLNKGVFQTLVGIMNNVTLKEIILEINAFYWNKAKYLMLSELLESLNGDISNLVMEYHWIEGLIHSLHKPGLVSAGADMYFSVLKKVYSDDVWCNLFLNSITKLLLGSSSKAIENFSNYWLLISLKRFPSLMNILIDELEKYDDTEQKLYSILFLMKQGNKLGVLNLNWDSTDIKTEKKVLSTIEHHNSKLRILAFDIVCLTHSKALPKQIEYSLILKYIETNINSDCTILRLSMINSLSVFLCHIHMLFKNMKDKNEAEDLVSFCRNLQVLLITSLNLNGNYQRKATNVKVINTVIECLNALPKKRKDEIKSMKMTLKQHLIRNENWIFHNKSSIMKLIDLLKDPSEDIRESVGRLLLHHYSEELKNTEILNQLVEDAMQCMQSKFFFQISCGQSMFKLVVNLLLKERHDKAKFKSVDEVFKYGYKELVSEYKLQQDILKSIEDGKQIHSFINILKVALEACIKNSYKLNVPDADINDLLDVLEGITNQFPWEQQNSTSSDFSQMNEMVENIIAKSGYEHLEKDETKISGLHQIILNCLWLNVKASCDLACLLINYYKNDISKCEKCLTIITHVLESSRHKGVIEGAGSALGSGIQLLTSLPEDSEASKLPQTLLKTKLDILILEASKMASITRRGAGLSIMVHRIVSSDMRKGKPLFHYFMKTLLKTCQYTMDIPNSEDKTNIENQMDLPKAIFIHFLTKIVTDSSLASDMMFYSAELAELAFSNLTSRHWQIRNAALQLYGALIPKLIGQMKPSGTDEEIIATVACDELRTHSPKLWNFTMEQLKNKSNNSTKINSHSNLVPILNMLASSAKRYNFSNDSKQQMASDQEMLFSLIRILDSPIHTVRRLTAKCIFNIFSFESIYDVIMKIDLNSENLTHGTLLLLKFCYKYYNLKDIHIDASNVLQEKYRTVINIKGTHSYWSREMYVNIYDDCINEVKEVLTELDENLNSPGVFLWAQTCIRSIILNSQWDSIPQNLHILLQRNDFEIYCEILLKKIEAESGSELILRQIVDILLSFEKKYQSSMIWTIIYSISLTVDLNNINVTTILNGLENQESLYTLRYIIPLAARLCINIDRDYQLKLSDKIFNLCNFENTDVDMRYIAALANNELASLLDKLSDNIKIASFKTAIILLQDEDEDVRNISVNYYRNIKKLTIAVHPNICLMKIFDSSFLLSMFYEPQSVIVLCEDVLKIISNSIHNHIDEYNPFANESKNIYLEVDVLRQTLETVLYNLKNI